MMRRTLFTSLRVFAGLAGLWLVVAGALEAQGGTVAGTVLERGTATPVAGARVLLSGTNRVAVTSQEGRFTLAGVPAGTYDVIIAMIGYGAASQRIAVAEGEMVSIDFSLTPVAVSLDALVVTATGEQRAKEVANVVSTVKAAERVKDALVTNFATLLTGQAANVTVLPSAGTSGSGSKVRIRGHSSVSLSNEPIYYIDGVRVEGGSQSLSVGTGGQSFSRINDINPEEIESIDIVKGPSAATLYGTQAANGVVRITTKRGIAGRPRWNIWSEYGWINDNNTYPTNFYSWGTNTTTSATMQCLLTISAANICTRDSLTSFNVLQDPTSSFFGTGNRGQVGLQVSGGSEAVQYFVSGEYENELGHYLMPDTDQARLQTERGLASVDDLPYEQIRPNEVRRVSVRSNVQAQLGRKADVSANVGLVLSDGRLPQNDNNVTGILPSGLFGKGFEGTRAGFGSQWGFFLPGEVFAILVNQDITRFTSALNASWRPTSYLTGRLTFGLDHTGRTDELLQRRDEGTAFSTFRRGRRQDNRFTINQYTLDLNGTATYPFGAELSGKTSVGVQYLRDYFYGVNAQGLELTPGAQTTGAGSIQSTSETTTEAITLGAYIEQVVGWKDRRFFTVALRRDDNSAFGKNFGAVVYPKVQASWVMSDEAFFPDAFPTDNLRVRAAYGQSGRQPGTTDATRFLQPTTATIAGIDTPGLIIGELGNADLEPERTAEIEAGFDAGFMSDRAHLEFTYYHKKTEDALVAVPIPPSLGASASQFQNLGSVVNEGIEGALTMNRDLSRSVGLDITLAGSWNRNELVTLGEGVNPIVLGDQRHVPGYPLFGYWARPLLGFDDRDGDGIIEYNVDTTLTEVFVGDTAEFLGYSIPRTQFSLNLGVRLFGDRVRIGGLLDYRTGFKQFNLTDYFRCTSSAANNCRAINDSTAPLAEQAAAVAGRTPALGTTIAGYVEDGGFFKLRELSFTFFAPPSLARAVRASNLAFTITGRNLATWTDYKGVDPEINQVGQSDIVRDFLTQPPVTYWTFRVTAGF